jgi:hypothetical protein
MPAVTDATFLRRKNVKRKNGRDTLRRNCQEFSRSEKARAGRDAGWSGRYVFASQKRKAQKWQGCHFCAAQGIEAEILLAERIAEPKDWSG